MAGDKQKSRLRKTLHANDRAKKKQLQITRAFVT